MPRTGIGRSPSFRVRITRRIHPAAVEALRREGFEVKVGGGLRGASRADALITVLSDRVDEALLRRCPRLKVVANYAVGFDNLDFAALSRRRIAATNTPDVLTRATAELAWALLLAASRRVPEGDRLVRAGRFKGWEPLMLLGRELGGKNLLVVGPGRIGRAVGRIGLGFGMRVRYAGRGARLGRLLPWADAVSLHVPLTPATRHLLDARALARMKPTAVLVNTARGPVVDEAALVRALRAGRLAAAGLDVYEREPALAKGLARLPNAVLLPHLGSATVEARRAMALRAAANVTAALRGRRPRDLLTPPPGRAQ